MDEFVPDPDALLSEMMENVDADLAAEAGAGLGDMDLGDADLAYDATDLPLEPDPFLDLSDAMVTEATAWAVQADIPLPICSTPCAAGGGVIGAVEPPAPAQGRTAQGRGGASPGMAPRSEARCAQATRNTSLSGSTCFEPATTTR